MEGGIGLNLLEAGETAVVAAGEGSGATVGTEDLHTHGTCRDFIVQGLRRRARIRKQHVGGDDPQGRRRGGGSEEGDGRKTRIISLQQEIGTW